MQNSIPDAVDAAKTRAMGEPQSPHRPATRPHFPAHASKAGSEPVNRSDAAASVDLSAASNMAAHGEDTAQQKLQGVAGVAPISKEAPMFQARNAEQWYQDSNKNASTRGNVSFIDDDPPFHLPQQSLKDSAAQRLAVRTTSAVGGYQPPSFSQQNTLQSSSSGEFRAVIDDLTVENKRLKRKLRAYERSQASQLHPDRMLEVRTSGLQGKDKQRLERLLKDFADSVSGSNKPQRPKLVSKNSKGSSKRPSSSATLHSTSNQVDSAYASGTGSAGNTSGSQSQRETHASESTMASNRLESRGKDTKIQSYLQNISQGLLPQRPTAMTEKTRKRLVVSRLEQLFTGRARTNAKNSQSDQQQEVSTAAANADKAASEAKGRPVLIEGSREANILQADAEAALLQAEHSRAKTTDDAIAVPGPTNAPDQRPTRPLDLDLNRAQNPAENLAYIRHLGINAQLNRAGAEYSDGDGWIYLNLLMGLAQLHTVNVTPAFVREAVKEVSDKFELSEDGSQIRWRGGTEGTQLIGEGGSDDGKNITPPDGAADLSFGTKAQSPSRSRSSKPSTSEQATGPLKSRGFTNELSATKTGSHDISSSTAPDDPAGRRRAPLKRPVYLGRADRENSFHYQPIFSHSMASEEGNDYVDEEDSLMSSGMREDTTGNGSSSQNTRSNGKVPRQRDDGPMIFYHQAQFVTDLSGDQGYTPVNIINYHRVCEEPADLKSLPKLAPQMESKGGLSSQRPGASTGAAPDECEWSQALGDLPPLELQIEPTSKTLSRNRPKPYPLPASGLGGVTPAENLVFYLEHRQQVSKSRQADARTRIQHRKYGSQLRKKLFDNDRTLLERIPKQESTHVQLTGSGQIRHIELPPSELPPPSYAFMHLSSSGGAESWDSDDESASKSVSVDLDVQETELPDFRPPATMRTHEETSADADVSSVGDEDMDDADDGEVDMLAHERELNAEDVAAREREWEEGLREPSPYAPSSAATVGDRSFLSSDEEDAMSLGKSANRRSTHAGSKRGREEVDGDASLQYSPAKRVETPLSRSVGK